MLNLRVCLLDIDSCCGDASSCFHLISFFCLVSIFPNAAPNLVELYTKPSFFFFKFTSHLLPSFLFIFLHSKHVQASFLVLPGVMVGHQKGQLESLLLVQPRVAERRVVCRKVVLVEPLAAAQALGDGIARELEVDAAEVAALLLVDAERLLELAVDVVEAAGLDARWGGEGVAVHGVALPDDAAAVLGVLDGADVRGEQVGDLAGAVAGDEGDLAGLAGGVEGAQQSEEVLGGRGRADLDADRVGDAAEELDVGVVELARAVADPDEVSRGVVVLLGFVAGDGSDGGR